MDTRIGALTEAFNRQQTEFETLVNLLSSRQKAIDDLYKIFDESQNRLSLLQEELSADTQVSEMASRIQTSTEELTKLVSTVKIPSLSIIKNNKGK